MKGDKLEAVVRELCMFARHGKGWPTLTVFDVATGILWWTALAAVLTPTVTRTRRITTTASVALVVGVVAIALLAYTAAEHLSP